MYSAMCILRGYMMIILFVCLPLYFSANPPAVYLSNAQSNITSHAPVADSLLAIALTPAEIEHLQELGVSTLLAFEEALNKIMDNTISNTYPYKTRIVNDLFESMDENDIEPDIDGNPSMKINVYLTLIENTKKSHRIKYDSIHKGDLYWNQFYFIKISYISSFKSRQKREAYISFENQQGVWHSKIFYMGFWKENKSLQHFIVPIRRMSIITPESTKPAQASHMEISWTDSIVKFNKGKVVKDSSTVRIELFYRNNLFHSLIGDRIPNNGKYIYKLKSIEERKDYRIKITNNARPSLSAISKNPFTIKCDLKCDTCCKVKKFILLKHPCEQTSFYPGDTLRLEWESEGVDNIRLEMIDESNKVLSIIHDKLENKSHCSWKLSRESPGRKNIINFKLRISETGNPRISAVTNCFYTILEPEQRDQKEKPKGKSR